MRRLLSVAALAVFLTDAGSAVAQSVFSYNFSSESPANAVAGSGPGVLGSAGDTWQVLAGDRANPLISGPGFIGASLIDVNGGASAITFTQAGFSAHNAGGFAVNNLANTTPLENSWFASPDFGPASYTFAGLRPGTTADLALFGSYHYPTGGASGFSRATDFTIDGTTKSTFGGDALDRTTLIEGEGYVLFEDVLVPGNGEILVEVGPFAPGAFLDVSGFQLSGVAVPEPASSLLIAIGIAFVGSARGRARVLCC